MATYTIFAGVNEAERTSIYKSTYYEQNKNEKRKVKTRNSLRNMLFFK